MKNCEFDRSLFDAARNVVEFANSVFHAFNLGNLHFAYVKKDDEYNQKLYKCQIFNSVLDITQGGSYANLSITGIFL